MEVFDRFNVWDKDEKKVKNQEKEKNGGRLFELDESGIKILDTSIKVRDGENRKWKPVKVETEDSAIDIEIEDASRIKETVAAIQKYLEENGISADIKDCIDRTEKLRNDVDQMENNEAIINSVRLNLHKLENQVSAVESRMNRLENSVRNMASYFRSMPF